MDDHCYLSSPLKVTTYKDPTRAMKPRRRSRRKAPLILHLGAAQRWVINFTPPSLYPRERPPVGPRKELDVHNSKIFSFCRDSKPGSCSPPPSHYPDHPTFQFIQNSLLTHHSGGIFCRRPARRTADAITGTYRHYTPQTPQYSVWRPRILTYPKLLTYLFHKAEYFLRS